jgi:hypothetical protein
VTGGVASPTVDSFDSPVRVGGTHSITTTGLGTLTTASTIGGKAISSASATGGDGTVTLPSFVSGQTYPAMGTQTFIASDGTNTASISRTLNTMTGWQYVDVVGLSSGDFSLGKAFTGGDTPTQLHVIDDGTGNLNADGTLTDWADTGTFTCWARMAAAGSYSGGEMVSFTFTVDAGGVDVAPTMPSDTSANVPENTTTVGTYAATTGTAPITYSLSGVDAGLFSINSSTGAVAFLSAPNYEAGSTAKSITVTATNAEGSDSQNITVNITNVVEAPVMPADGSYSVTEGQTTVGNPSASFVDGVITYSKSGANQALFNINSSTGALTFISPAVIGSYSVTVTATNSAGSDAQNLTVNVIAALSSTGKKSISIYIGLQV